MKLFDAPWASQPRALPSIDAGSPLARGLLFHAPLHPVWGMRDLVAGGLATRTGLTSRAVTVAGVLPLFGTSSYADFAAPASFNGSLPFTIAWVQQPISPAGYSTVLDVRPPVNSAKSFLIYQSAADTSYQFVVGPRDGGSTGKQARFAMGLQTDGLLDVYVLVAPAGLATATASYVLYRNGVKQAAAVAESPFGNASHTGMRVGGVLGSPGDPFEGALGGLTIWQRSISDAEAALFSRNPSAIYAAQRRIYTPGFTVSAGGAAVGLASESDSALAAAGVQRRGAGLAAESDSALSLAAKAVRAVGLAAESDLALARLALQVRPAGVSVEADSAIARLPAAAPGSVGLSIEADSAFARPPVQIKPAALATEADSALALTGTKAGSAGLAAEADSALALAPRQARVVGLAAEIDQALAITNLQVGGVGLALEISASFALPATQRRSAGMAQEFDSALSPAGGIAGPEVLAAITAGRSARAGVLGARRAQSSSGRRPAQ